MKRMIASSFIFLLFSSLCFSQVFENMSINDTHLTSYFSYSYGCTWVDANNDDQPDIFIANGPDERNVLYYNSASNTFFPGFHSNISNYSDWSFAASWADYDNDGFLDLFIANVFGTNQLFHNTNGEVFFLNDSPDIINAIGGFYGCSWADYDNDGLIDLFLTDWYMAGPNCLFHNNGNGNFSRDYSSPLTNNNSQAVCSTWIDYDDDGDQDVFITTDYYNENMLFDNDGNGIFTRNYTSALVLQEEKSNSASWADYDNDGDFDLFVSTTGNLENLFYRNEGAGDFAEITDLNINTDCGYSRSSCWSDFDNDGYIDLFVSNGYLEIFKDNFLYMNNGDGTFERILNGCIATDGGSSLGCSSADYNDDGLLDLFVVNGAGYESQCNFLYKNITRTRNHWIKIKCEGTESNRAAIGTKFYLYAFIDGKYVKQSRYISSTTGRASQNDLIVHFGLGDATVIDSIVVKWPSGIIDILHDIQVDDTISILENETNEFPDPIQQNVINSKIGNYPNPFNPSTTIRFTLSQSTNVSLNIYNMKGQRVKQLIHSKLPAGKQSILWNGKDENDQSAASGIYFYRFVYDGIPSADIHRMMLLK